MKNRTSSTIFFNLLPVWILGVFFLSGCEDRVFESSATFSDNNGSTTESDAWQGGSAQWLIELEEIIDGGPGKDGIPSIDEPNYSFTYNTDFIPDHRMVVGVLEQGDIRAYPTRYLIGTKL